MGKLIAIAGLAGSGKDTIGEYLCSQYLFKKDSFAAPLKDAVSSIFGWDRSKVEGTTPEGRAWREQVDPWWAEKLSMPHLTPRWALQNFGTEVFRQHFHDKIWMLSFENRIIQTDKDVVVTDARFPNELDLIRSIGGRTILVKRGPNPEWWDLAASVNTEPNEKLRSVKLNELKTYGVHPSEYSWVGLNYDFIVENNSTKDALYAEIDKFLKVV
jgi:hypothetical protein